MTADWCEDKTIHMILPNYKDRSCNIEAIGFYITQRSLAAIYVAVQMSYALIIRRPKG